MKEIIVIILSSDMNKSTEDARADDITYKNIGLSRKAADMT